jgi:hypothetical protein
MKLNRRQAILGLGTAAAGGSAIVSSGAFTQVEATRNVTFQTADDTESALRLEANNPIEDGSISGVSSIVNTNIAISDYADPPIGDNDSRQALSPYAGDTSNYLNNNENGLLELDISGSNIANAGGLNGDGITVFEDLIRVTNDGIQTLALAVDVPEVLAGVLDFLVYREQTDGAGQTISIVDEANEWAVSLDHLDAEEGQATAGVTVVIDAGAEIPKTSEPITIRADADEVEGN